MLLEKGAWRSGDEVAAVGVRPPLTPHDLGWGATGDGRVILEEVLFSVEEFLGGGGGERGRRGRGPPRP